jgi:pentatricopeptide repeat protein
MLEEVRELDKERRAAAILPNASLYSTLILVACEEGKISEAWQYVAEMKDARLPLPTPASCVSLVQLCVKTDNHLDDAWKLLLELEEQGFELADLGAEARDLKKEVRAKRAAAQAGGAAPLPHHQPPHQHQRHHDDVVVVGGNRGASSFSATTGIMSVIRNLVEDQALSEEEGRAGTTTTTPASSLLCVGGSWPSHPMEGIVEQLQTSEEVTMELAAFTVGWGGVGEGEGEGGGEGGGYL